jgi:hypothetical protein
MELKRVNRHMLIGGSTEFKAPQAPPLLFSSSVGVHCSGVQVSVMSCCVIVTVLPITFCCRSDGRLLFSFTIYNLIPTFAHPPVAWSAEYRNTSRPIVLRILFLVFHIDFTRLSLTLRGDTISLR